MMTLIFRWVVIFVFAIGILALLIYIFLKPQFSVHADGTTISVLQNTFYIASDSPTKVYRFDPHPQELNKILENNTKNYPATFGIYIKNIIVCLTNFV